MVVNRLEICVKRSDARDWDNGAECKKTNNPSRIYFFLFAALFSCKHAVGVPRVDTFVMLCRFDVIRRHGATKARDVNMIHE